MSTPCECQWCGKRVVVRGTKVEDFYHPKCWAVVMSVCDRAEFARMRRLDASDVIHGTHSRYSHGCRCRACTDAHARYEGGRSAAQLIQTLTTERITP